MVTIREEFKRKKRYLSRYRHRIRKIEQLETKLIEKRLSNKRLHSVQVTGMPSGGVPKTMDDKLQEIQDLDDRITRLQVKARNIRMEITDVIDELDERESEILEMYFVEDMDIYSISTKTKYSYDRAMHLYSSGVNHCEIPDR